METRKVAVGISGGVDSAVCAALLKEQGYQVTGIFLNTGCQPDASAQRVCKQLGIPWVTDSVADELRERVMIPFAQGYCHGLTPNPCVICNPTVKFPALARLAERMGIHHIATGHYVRAELYEGVTYLRQGAVGRDQSYMLHRLPQSILSRCLFPLGEMTKDVVRAKARSLGLYAADAPDSMDICFAKGVDYPKFIEELGYTTQPGDFVDVKGKVLGKHEGLHHYTVGQRRGLGISADDRLFVLRLDTERNRVVLGSEDYLFPKRFIVGQVVLVPGLELPLEADIRVRYSKEAVPAVVSPLSGNRAEITFTETPARAPTPGQSAVFYQDDVVAGGGIIQRWELETN